MTGYIRQTHVKEGGTISYNSYYCKNVKGSRQKKLCLYGVYMENKLIKEEDFNKKYN